SKPASESKCELEVVSKKGRDESHAPRAPTWDTPIPLQAAPAPAAASRFSGFCENFSLGLRECARNPNSCAGCSTPDSSGTMDNFRCRDKSPGATSAALRLSRLPRQNSSPTCRPSHCQPRPLLMCRPSAALLRARARLPAHSTWQASARQCASTHHRESRLRGYGWLRADSPSASADPPPMCATADDEAREQDPSPIR